MHKNIAAMQFSSNLFVDVFIYKIFKRKVIYSNMTFSNKNSQITYVKTLF